MLFLHFAGNNVFFFKKKKTFIKMSHMPIRGSMDDKRKIMKITQSTTALTPTMWVFGVVTFRNFCLLARGWVFDTGAATKGLTHVSI